MSQISGPISINNGAATPVAKSFAPERVSPEASVFTERTAVASAGYTRLSVRYSVATSRRPSNRVDIDLDYPVLSVVDGINTVGYVGRFKGFFVIPDQMTALERADLHAFVANALDAAVVKAVVKDLDPMY